jgi:hypothetical protein
VTDAHAGDIGDGIMASRPKDARLYAEIARARALTVRRGRECRDKKKAQGKEVTHEVSSQLTD